MLDHLNKDQLRAVTSNQSHQMIIAGPGTGKTKTLVARYQYLIDQSQIRPESILIITFTNKAVDELKKRISDIDNASIFTFHGLGYQILSPKTKEESSKVKIIDNADQFEIINSLIKQFSLSIKAKELILLISKYKNSIDEDDLTNIKKIVSQYQSFLDERKLIDFDDLLLQSIELLKKNNQVRAKWQSKVRYMLIDEFQDTNNLQYQLVKVLNPNHLFIIGDPLQSIYGFRGANAKIFDQLKKDFSQIEQIKLKDHYRCRPEVINSALALFPDRISLQAMKKSGGIVQVVQTRNSKTEAKWIENKIENGLGGSNLISAGIANGGGKRLKDFAVIFRTRRLAHQFIKYFSVSGLPYQLVGELSPFQTPLVEKIVRVFLFLTEKNIGFLDPLKLNKSQLRNLTYLIDHYSNQSIKKTIDQIINCLEIELSDEQKANLLFINQTWSQFEDQENKLNKIIEYLQLIKTSDYFDQSVDKISVMTIHAVKGLEFDTVFIGGFEQGIIPIKKALEAGEIEEEKRLLFVAMTRAENELYLLQTDYRMGKQSKRSQFLDLIKNNLTVVEDVEKLKWTTRKKKIEEKKRQGRLF